MLWSSIFKNFKRVVVACTQRSGLEWRLRMDEALLRRVAQLEDSCALLFQQGEWAAVHIVRLEAILFEHQRRLAALSSEIQQLRRAVLRLARAIRRCQVFIQRVSEQIGEEEERTQVAEVQFEQLQQDVEQLRLRFSDGLNNLD